MPPTNARPRMTNAAFAGFLRLLLTPLNEAPKSCPELDAYLRYLSRANPRADAGRAAA